MKKYDMSFAEAQDFCTKIGLDVPWNDGDVVIDNKCITESIANAVKWSLDNHLEKVTGRVEISGDMYSYMDKSEIDWEEYNWFCIECAYKWWFTESTLYLDKRWFIYIPAFWKWYI